MYNNSFPPANLQKKLGLKTGKYQLVMRKESTMYVHVFAKQVIIDNGNWDIETCKDLFFE